MNTEVQTYVQQVVSDGFTSFLEQNPSAARKIIQKCLTSARARDAARKARDLVIRKSALESMTLPGKLADCSNATRTAQSSISSRVIPQAGQPNRVVTVTFKPSCLYAAKSSTQSEPAWIKFWQIGRSKP